MTDTLPAMLHRLRDHAEQFRTLVLRMEHVLHDEPYNAYPADMWAVLDLFEGKLVEVLETLELAMQILEKRGE